MQCEDFVYYENKHPEKKLIFNYADGGQSLSPRRRHNSDSRLPLIARSQPTASALKQLTLLRKQIRGAYLADETEVVANLLQQRVLSEIQSRTVSEQAAEIVKLVRAARDVGPMSSFLLEYSLTTQEGIALMCLAEALLRVPDESTINELIQDKISAGDWGRHLGHSSSSLVNASTWALMLTGRILKDEESDDVAELLRFIVQRLGEPVVRVAVARGIRLVGNQFILGNTIQAALKRGQSFVKKGFTYSYDMLGESALTAQDAMKYTHAYSNAISNIASGRISDFPKDNPGISVKLSALHPRYLCAQRSNIVDELAESVLILALQAKEADLGFNIDAEEADTLEISLDVIEKVLSNPLLRSWDGFGVVVQAYSRRAMRVIDWLYALAEHLDRKIMVRLVKGAYWDTEIKRAQVLGLRTFPVFTRKSSTDLSYLACAKKLLKFSDRIYPQFATHNVHSICAVNSLAENHQEFEFQRLHGMGETVYETAKKKFGRSCRIYAPVGAHEDLLAYLVRRILENGANSSFINQLMNKQLPIEKIIQDPASVAEQHRSSIPNPVVCPARDLFGKSRINSRGWDLADEEQMHELRASMSEFKNNEWRAQPTDWKAADEDPVEHIRNPADLKQLVGTVVQTPMSWIDGAIQRAQAGFSTWRDTPPITRSSLLNAVAEAYESAAPELMALMVLETGKTVTDAMLEIREAVDFCRYYAQDIVRLERVSGHRARGAVACISPWNFPLAIFTGQISAAVAAGNSVIAKPAEQSPLTGAKAVEIMHQAGIPRNVVQILPGYGETVGSSLVADSRLAGVVFTGSTQAARSIHRDLAASGNPLGFLVAETGGINAMMADSTALPEQAVLDIVHSAFQSAGQRCSALRVLYVQREIKTKIYDMLIGAAEQLRIGNPWECSTDIGPVVSEEAFHHINKYCSQLKAEGKLLYQTPIPTSLDGWFIPPTIFEVTGIQDLKTEIFGPVLHVTTYESNQRLEVIDRINRSGYGLTFGLHSRVDRRVQQVVGQVSAGNIYVNRNQIGAVVGCQPFGGTGKSGTGPKAGGPFYVARMRSFQEEQFQSAAQFDKLQRGNVQEQLEQLSLLQLKWHRQANGIARIKAAVADCPTLIQSLDEVENFYRSPIDLDGPTGESNRLYLEPKGVFICLGSSVHAVQALATGNAVLAVGIDRSVIDALERIGAPIVQSDFLPDSESLKKSNCIAGIALSNTRLSELTRTLRRELASRKGPIVQFIIEQNAPWQFLTEKSLCIDTTAAGGNAKLLLESGS